MDIREMNKYVGNIDLHLLDEILKGSFDTKMRILDAGCGEGRNLVYFIQEGYDVDGIDPDAGAIRMLKYTTRSLNKTYDADKFMIGEIEKLPYEDHSFNAVICNAVLHFAENEDHFFQMMGELARVLSNSGFLFIQMSSNIGWAGQLKPLGEGKYMMPDESVRFVLTEKIFKRVLQDFHLNLLQPIRTMILGAPTHGNSDQIDHSQSDHPSSCSSILLLGAR